MLDLFIIGIGIFTWSYCLYNLCIWLFETEQDQYLGKDYKILHKKVYTILKEKGFKWVQVLIVNEHRCSIQRVADNSWARITIGKSFMELLNDDELKACVYHELGHLFDKRIFNLLHFDYQVEYDADKYVEYFDGKSECLISALIKSKKYVHKIDDVNHLLELNSLTHPSIKDRAKALGVEL